MGKIELTDRQKMILSLIVQEYVDTGKPIGSNPLAIYGSPTPRRGVSPPKKLTAFSSAS
jgi:hypothetical protein